MSFPILRACVLWVQCVSVTTCFYTSRLPENAVSPVPREKELLAIILCDYDTPSFQRQLNHGIFS